MTLDGSGFLVPRVDGRLLTACTWLSAKWAHLDSGAHTLLRASAGRFGDDRAVHLDDAVLVERVHGELVDAMGLDHDPIETRVDRWHDAFPQYEVGHAERVIRIEAALHDLPGVVVAGAAYRGIGIAACVQQGGQAAAEVGRILS
jgi:oxygen-dependent protoporphyrinogen oxidase